MYPHRKLTKERLKVIEELHDSRQISDSQYDTLDTAARIEGGLITYEDVFADVVERDVLEDESVISTPLHKKKKV